MKGCGLCADKDCVAPEGWVCMKSGDFFTTGEYSRTIKEFDIHGVSFNQEIDSVSSKLDVDTIRILKVLICDSNRWEYPTVMEIMFLLDEIKSKLSNDNTENEVFNNSYHSGSDKDV